LKNGEKLNGRMIKVDVAEERKRDAPPSKPTIHVFKVKDKEGFKVVRAATQPGQRQ